MPIDLVINGAEIGGGSIRIHDRELQEKNFKLLGFTPEEAENQFGFLMGAFEYWRSASMVVLPLASTAFVQ